MSFGRPCIGLRSRPTIDQPRSWCRRRATMWPKRPLMPVTTTFFGRGIARSVIICCGSPEDMFALAQADVDHRLDPVAHLLHFLVEVFVVVIGVAGEVHRLAEVEPVLHG